jgi:hypothetical protein
MKYYCNPINTEYRYQFNQDPRQGGKTETAREAADPSMIYYEGKYYIFASMTLGVWVSDDLAKWENHRLPDNLPLYDYAPDVRVVNGYVYVCASKLDEICNYYRTRDILNGPYEEIKGTFPFWDPHLFQDDNGRVYFYWGCSNMTPIWGIEVNPETMKPLTEKKVLIDSDVYTKGYERGGEDHSLMPLDEASIEQAFNGFLAERGLTVAEVPENMANAIRGMVSRRPYIEGAWMNKHNGKYYLQYACPGAELNTYADGVYISDRPLGDYTLAANNPFSYKPGGFLPGAGHGSTAEDRYGNLWHTSTMRISVNHIFERRVGLWPAGFDADGELYCNQNYGDWPRKVADKPADPWEDPEWFLLSYKKTATASSFEEGKEPSKALDENVRTWWRAGNAAPGEWLLADLEGEYEVHAVQINFADDKIDIPVPGTVKGAPQPRYIEEAHHVTRWLLEGSKDGKDFFTLEDKSEADTNLPHDLVVIESGANVRYLRLTVFQIPYDQKPCISGLRVFGRGNGDKPTAAEYEAVRTSPTDMEVTIANSAATGYNILWGHTPEKLYHSYQIFDTRKTIGALVKGQNVYTRVDSFNENGITKGICKKVSTPLSRNEKEQEE